MGKIKLNQPDSEPKRNQPTYNTMATKIADKNVIFFNAAIYYHIETVQTNPGQDVEVKYPNNMFVDYETFIGANGELGTSIKKTKVFSADSIAAAAIDEILNKIIDEVKSADESDASAKTVAEFAEGRPGFMQILDTVNKKLSLPDDFAKDVKGKIAKDVLSGIKRRCKVSGNKRHNTTDEFKANVAEGFMKWLFHAARYVAISLVFNIQSTISKFNINAVNTGLFLAAIDAGAKLEDLYTATNGCETWSVQVKKITKKAKTEGAEDKKSGAGKSKNKKSVEVSDSDEDEAPRRGDKKKVLKKKKDESDDEDVPKKGAKKASKKEESSDSEDEAPKRRSASKIQEDEEASEEEDADE